MKKVAFDIGNVLVDVYLDKFISLLEITGAVSSHEEGFEFLTEIQIQQDLGLTDIKKSLNRFNLNTAAKNKLVDCWNYEVISYNHQMISMIDNLNNQDYDIALLSNIGFNHAEQIRKHKLLGKLNLHFSCEVGARKPTKLFYQSFLLENPDFKGCIFIDDIQENLETATKLGFHSYNFNLSKSKTDSEITDLFYYIKFK